MQHSKRHSQDTNQQVTGDKCRGLQTPDQALNAPLCSSPLRTPQNPDLPCRLAHQAEDKASTLQLCSHFSCPTHLHTPPLTACTELVHQTRATYLDLTSHTFPEDITSAHPQQQAHDTPARDVKAACDQLTWHCFRHLQQTISLIHRKPL